MEKIESDVNTVNIVNEKSTVKEEIQQVLSSICQNEKSLHCNIPQGSQDWHNLRNRITASKLGFLAFAKTEEQKQQAARQMLGLERVVFTEEQMQNMKIGTDYEDTVRQYISKTHNMKIYQLGIFINRQYPFLAGSPDGIMEDGTIIEIKISSKDVPDSYTDDFSEIPIYYLYQMYLNMYNINSKNCLYIMYSRKSGNLYTRLVPFNYLRFVREILIPSINFYNDYIVPLIEENNLESPSENFQKLLLKY